MSAPECYYRVEQTDGRSLINDQSEPARHATTSRRAMVGACEFNIAASEQTLLVSATTLGGAIHR